jgi:hypothetical protein
MRGSIAGYYIRNGHRSPFFRLRTLVVWRRARQPLVVGFQIHDRFPAVSGIALGLAAIGVVPFLEVRMAEARKKELGRSRMMNGN